jgi:hypothetical protein
MPLHWTIYNAIPLVALGFILSLRVVWAGQRILPHLGGTTLAWSLTLAAWALAAAGGAILALALDRLRRRVWQAILLGCLFAGALAVTFLRTPHFAAASWSLAPVTTGMAFLGIELVIPLLPLWCALWLVLRWTPSRATKPGMSFALIGMSCLGGIAGLLLFYSPLEPASVDVSWKVCCVLVLPLVIVASRAPAVDEAEEPSADAAALETSWKRRLYWGVAAFFSVSLLVEQTRYLSDDIAPTTLLWTVPFVLFLLAWAQGTTRLTIGNYLSRQHPMTLGVILAIPFLVVFLILSGLTLMDLQNVTTTGVLGGLLVSCCLLLPTCLLAIAQPLSVVAALVFLLQERSFGFGAVLASSIAVYFTVRSLFTELNRSHPADSRSLSFHAWMTGGATLGAIFAAVVAPFLVFHPAIEFAAMLALACAFRLAWLRNGLSDMVVANTIDSSSSERTTAERDRLALAFDGVVGLLIGVAALGAFWASRGFLDRNPQMAAVGDFRWRPFVQSVIAFGPALILCLTLVARPARFALALACLSIGSPYISESMTRDRKGRDLAHVRTSFAPLRITEAKTPDNRGTMYELMDGSTLHGTQVLGSLEERRLATTYYHAKGPVGQVMRRMKWFPGAPESASDARIVASLVGQAGGIGNLTLPMNASVAVWSEPPVAVLGVECGTMAIYARPFQWFDFYELDPGIVQLSLPASAAQPRRFDSLVDAQDRGAFVRVFHGDPRQALHEAGPRRFYSVVFAMTYHSDAIPNHMATKEALEEYRRSLIEDGLICFHTSNRWMQLPPVLARSASAMKWVAAVAGDQGPDNRLAQRNDDQFRFSSEWTVIVPNARQLTDRKLGWFRALDPKFEAQFRREQFLPETSAVVWSDDYAPALEALRFSELPAFLNVIGACAGVIAFVMLFVKWIAIGLPDPSPRPREAPVLEIELVGGDDDSDLRHNIRRRT